MTNDPKQTEAAKAKTKAKEVPDEALDKVAGGLNPQPLPPRWGGKGGF